MGDVKNSTTAHPVFVNRLEGLIEELFDANKFDNQYPPSVYVAWAVLNYDSSVNIEDVVEDVMRDSERGDIGENYYGNYADLDEANLISDLEESGLRLSDVTVWAGHVFTE